MEKYDTSQLTEFPRFESESNQSGVSTFFNKLWKFPIFSPNEGESPEAKPSEKPSEAPESEAKQEYDDKAETASYAVEFEGRSLPNVLRRISSLVASGSGGGTRYADTELARYWMPDDISRECYECAARFGALRRRHHCRVCGQIFCSRCCSQRVPGQIFGCAGGLRVCTYCCNVVLSYLREHDMAGDISPDLRTLHENLQVKFPENREQSAPKSRDFVFAREHDERCETLNCPKEALHDAFRQLVYTLPTQQHRYRLVRYIGVWRGCDIVQWVMENTPHKTRGAARAFCVQLVAEGLVRSACGEGGAGEGEGQGEAGEREGEAGGVFAEHEVYRPARTPDSPRQSQSVPAEDCNRLVESVSSYCLDLNLGNSSARLIKATKTERKSSTPSEEEHPIIDHNGECGGRGGEGEGEEEEERAAVCRGIAASGAEHLRLLARQCLARRALPPHWLHAVYTLATHAAHIISIDMMCSDMDVRNYVQVKKVPGGSVSDCCVIPGVVISKNVAHRGMPQQISNPTVLLLDCSIAYQRVEGKLTSLEPVLLQEQEYLVRCAARITALRPNVVLVRGGAARGVQDALRAAGVALATTVRDRALRRVARCARADRVASIDARIGMPRLGTCSNFYVKNYSGKSLMVLEGCAEPQLGCCILLRGGTLQELIRVKKVVKFMLLACYNWKLEKAFLADIEAVLPEPGTFVDDDDDNDVTENNDTGLHKSRSEVSKTEVRDGEKNDADKLNISDEINDDVFGLKNSDVLEGDNVCNIAQSDVEGGNVEAKTSETEEINKINDGVKTDDDEQKQYENNEKSKENESNNDKLESTEASKVKESDESIQKTKPYARKTDSDKNLSCGVPIRDFSDPLRSRMSVDDEVFLPKEEATLKADTQSERWCTDDVVLSMSPNIVIPAPPSDVVTRLPPPTPHTPRAFRREPSKRPATHVFVKESHPFIKQPITSSMDDPLLRASLANYRAVGCRLLNDKHKRECPLYKPSVLKKVEPESETNSKQSEANEPLDPLSPENHQRLSLLLYSYSSKSPNVPDFCVNPWVVTMEMYGRHDISLGAFLEKYCFSAVPKCPAAGCPLPMNQHVRKFVHGDVCITLTCNTIGHSNVDKEKEEMNKQVRFWSRCVRCGAVSRGCRVSRAARCVSLAQYVRGRVCAARYSRPPCPHPLTHHDHAFLSRLTTACFKYSKISTYDIQLPPDVISIQYDTKQMRESLIAQLNELMLKGHEIFSNAAEGEAEKEYQMFKQHADTIHLALTAPNTIDQDHAETVRRLWSVADNIVVGEKMLRDAHDRCPHKPPLHQHNIADDKLDSEDSTGDAGSNEVTDNSSKELEKEHTGGEEDEDRGDKKTVKQILQQLLSNNQQQNQGGMIISSGLIPVVVLAGEIGSVIAATLASHHYQRALRELLCSAQSEQEEENASSGKDKVDGDKSKAKSNEHIEVLLKDGLPCRVYYAAQFHRLRHALLAPLSPKDDARCCDDVREKDRRGLCGVEEGFVRSLAHCVPWAARGGKSGSTFCKTRDDRYVLKEMTKPEWQQFLEFAPHYFHYVTACRQRRQPSLLARILGVFSVGGAGSGVLVLEHVWYARSPSAPRFDLKGTSRPRLLNTATTTTTTSTAALASPTVLLDENLLRMRWERPLYVRGEAGRTVRAAVERDSQFLADHHVMDYSLLLAVDDATLVLGIIDYIRTFTWDKKLEHLVKKNLGSGQPTVVSPHQYRTRFAAAARKYFLHCPQHWDVLAQPAPDHQLHHHQQQQQHRSS